MRSVTAEAALGRDWDGRQVLRPRGASRAGRRLARVETLPRGAALHVRHRAPPCLDSRRRWQPLRHRLGDAAPCGGVRTAESLARVGAAAYDSLSSWTLARSAQSRADVLRLAMPAAAPATDPLVAAANIAAVGVAAVTAGMPPVSEEEHASAAEEVVGLGDESRWLLSEGAPAGADPAAASLRAATTAPLATARCLVAVVLLQLFGKESLEAETAAEPDADTSEPPVSTCDSRVGTLFSTSK